MQSTSGNHIDTAAFYFSSLRSANELINSALAPYPDDLVITTKVGPHRDAAGEWLPWARPDQLRGQVEENLRQLGREQLDVVNLRAYGPAPISDHFGPLSEPYGIGFRHDSDEFVRACGADGVAFVPFFALAGTGREAGASGTERDEILAVARAHGASGAQVRLAWTLQRGAHVLAIPGTSDPEHLVANVASGASGSPTTT